MTRCNNDLVDPGFSFLVLFKRAIFTSYIVNRLEQKVTSTFEGGPTSYRGFSSGYGGRAYVHLTYVMINGPSSEVNQRMTRS